jgi:DnaJ-class molecular chaperone
MVPEQSNCQPREWQRCPICCGSGRLWNVLMPTTTDPCHRCAGTGTIERPTGFPHMVIRGSS